VRSGPWKQGHSAVICAEVLKAVRQMKKEKTKMNLIDILLIVPHVILV
jgi:hypothetical protein